MQFLKQYVSTLKLFKGTKAVNNLRFQPKTVQILILLQMLYVGMCMFVPFGGCFPIYSFKCFNLNNLNTNCNNEDDKTCRVMFNQAICSQTLWGFLSVVRDAV